ncbi:MAG: hypothetical protein ACE5HI_09625 [bacterium]
MLNRNILVVFLLLLVLIIFACGKEKPVAPEITQNEEIVTLAKQNDAAAEIIAMVEAANARLEAEGSNYRIDRAFYYTASHEAGQTIFFDDRTKQLALHFVPGDPRRVGGANTDIAYMVDQVQASNLPIPTTTAAIDRAMTTWDGVSCSNIPITQLPNPGFDLGFVAGGFPA